MRHSSRLSKGAEKHERRVVKRKSTRELLRRTRKGIWHVGERLILFSRLVSQAETISQHIFRYWYEIKRARGRGVKTKVELWGWIDNRFCKYPWKNRIFM